MSSSHDTKERIRLLISCTWALRLSVANLRRNDISNIILLEYGFLAGLCLDMEAMQSLKVAIGFAGALMQSHDV